MYTNPVSNPELVLSRSFATTIGDQVLNAVELCALVFLVCFTIAPQKLLDSNATLARHACPCT